MKILSMLIAGTALAVAATAPAAAQRVMTHTTTTVTKVHGPMHILPHHKHKICKTRWVHHKKVQKCYHN